MISYDDDMAAAQSVAGDEKAGGTAGFQFHGAIRAGLAGLEVGAIAN